MKNHCKKKITKEYNKILSPTSKNYKNTFSQNLFKEVEISKLGLSQKKSENELILSKKKNISNNYHRRTKSNNQNNVENMDNNYKINSSVHKLSFVAENKENEVENEESQFNNKSAISRNKKKILYRPMGNLLSISFSLKDISKNLIESCYSNKNGHFSKNYQYSIHKYCNNDTNLKYNKSVYFNDFSTNIDETRNTTSNTNKNQINKSIILYNKYYNNEKEKDKSKKCIKTNKKQKKKLYSSMDNDLKKKYLKANDDIIHEHEKDQTKNNLHRFIYNNNNIKSKKNFKTNNNYNNCTHYLYSLKNSFFRNSEKKANQKSLVNPIYESCNDESLIHNKPEKEISVINNAKTFQKNAKFMNRKDNISSSVKNESKKIIVPKNKKKTNKSQEKQNKTHMCEIEPIKEFETVEEIHFMFVQMNQRKNSFLNKYDKKK